MSELSNVKNKRHKSLFLIIPLCILLLITLLSGIVVTHQNEYKVIKQFGAVVRIIQEPGLTFKKPFIQTTQSIPDKIMIYDVPPSDVITSDKKSMIADCFVIWRITDPYKFIRSLSASISNAEYRLDNIVYNSLKNTISSMKQEMVISSRDGLLADTILKNCGSSSQEYGIVISAVETKMLDMPEENKEAVYQRMISERGNIAATYTAEGESQAKQIRNEADKQVTIMKSEAQAKATEIKADGDAEYMRILSQAYNTSDKAEFYQFMISLDAAKTSLSGGNKTLILDSTSPIAKIFYNK